MSPSPRREVLGRSRRRASGQLAYRCIMPSVVDVAKCYPTKVISTSDKAKFPGATHVPFDPARGSEAARQIVKLAVDAYPDRNQERARLCPASWPPVTSRKPRTG
jgi:hydroxylamine reductase (hybrid-cluster protein)